jgi:amino acid adenylation domain-containing protein
VSLRDSVSRRRAALSPAARAALAERLRGTPAPATATPTTPAAGIPLSETQEQFWLHQHAYPQDSAANVFLSVRLRGPLDVAALQRGCDLLAARHDILRSRFVEVDGRPQARVSATDRLPLRHVTGGDLTDLARAEATRPFDLAAEPPVRGLLVRVVPDEHVLMLTLHHIATDAWSNAVLLAELATAYGTGRLSPPTLQFAEHVRRQRIDRDRLAGFWRTALDGAPHGLALPTDATVGSGVSARLVTTIPAEDLLALDTLDSRSSTFVGLLAVLQATLARYTGATDFLVGVPFSGRRSPDLAGVIGPLFTALPLRADLSGNPTFRQLIDRVRTTAAAAFSHGDVPPARFVAPRAGAPLYDVLFALQEAPDTTVRVAGLEIEPVALGDGTAQCPLTLSATPQDGGLSIVTDYDTALFDRETVAQLMRHYGRLLAAVTAEPDVPVADVAVLTDAEREHLLVDRNQTDVPRESTQLVHELFRRQVRRTPDAPAVTGGTGTLSYADLERRALATARYLAARGVRRGDVVGVCVERSPDLAVALLAVLFAGAAYLPLEPAHPVERRERALADAGARVLLTGHDPATHLAGGIPAPEWTVDPGDRPLPDLTAADLAYVMYTSGSTGRPKGVLVGHEGVCNDLAWRATVTGLGPGDRLLHTVSFAFDPSVWQLFGPLAAGAEVVLAAQQDAADPDRVCALVRRHRVTIVDAVPSVLAQLLDVHTPGDLDTLTHVFCGGERLPRDLTDRVHRTLGAALHNQYGPTEATIDTTSHLVAPDEGGHDVSIGRPIDNKRCYVLDGRLAPVPVRVAGELWIGGTGLAYGYLGSPAATADRFRPDPYGVPGARMYRSGDLVRHRHDGTLDFLGRIDDQVKVNGVRIEPAEVADALRSHPTVTDAVVVRREVRGRHVLVGYAVCTDDLDAEAMRAHLAALLPPAFLPAHLVRVDRIPRRSTGKVATDELPEVAENHVGRIATPGSTEDAVAGIWRAVLETDESIDLDTDFFALGGDSLLAVRLVAAVRNRFAIELALHEFFETATVAGLAKRVDVRLSGTASTTPELRRRTTDRVPLSYAQERIYGRDRAGARPEELQQTLVAHLTGDLDVEVMRRAVSMVVARHEALRMAVDEHGQVARPPADVPLGGTLSLADGVLLTPTITAVGPREHELSLTLHRIASDGMSTQLLARDLAACYAALRTGVAPSLPALPVSHADYAAWERATVTADLVADAVGEWRRTLPGLADLAELAAAPRSLSRHRNHHRLQLDAPTVAAFEDLAKRERVSLRVVLLTVWATACARRFGDDLLICTPVSGRDHPELSDVVGRFVNMVVLPISLPAGSLAARLDHVKATTLDAYRRQRLLPFVALERAIAGDNATFSPVFPLLFDLADRPAELPGIPGLDVVIAPPHEHTTDFGLALQAHHVGDQLELLMLHDPELYDTELTAALFGDVRRLIADITGGDAP